jgi:hypothetical protein
MEWGPCVGPTSLCLSVVLCECFNHFSPYTPTLSHEVSECVIRSFFFFFFNLFSNWNICPNFCASLREHAQGSTCLGQLRMSSLLVPRRSMGYHLIYFSFFFGYYLSSCFFWDTNTRFLMEKPRKCQSVHAYTM